MALVAASYKELVIIFEDSGFDKSSVRMKVNAGIDGAGARAIATAFANLSDAKVSQVNLIEISTDATATAEPRSRVENKLRLYGRSTAGNAQFDVPAPKPSLFRVDGTVDTANPLMGELLGAIGTNIIHKSGAVITIDRAAYRGNRSGTNQGEEPDSLLGVVIP